MVGDRTHTLANFPLAYELTPTDDLLKKIMRRTRSLKLSILRGSWYARIRVNINGQREEVAGIAQSPREALSKLDKRMTERGIYNV